MVQREWCCRSEELKAPRCLWPPPFLPRHQLSALSASQMLLQRGGISRWHHSRGGRNGTGRAGEGFENLLITLHLLENSIRAEKRRSLKAVRGTFDWSPRCLSFKSLFSHSQGQIYGSQTFLRLQTRSPKQNNSVHLKLQIQGKHSATSKQSHTLVQKLYLIYIL